MAYAGHREYMRIKNAKLEVQNGMQKSSQSDLFATFCFYFDGYSGNPQLTILDLKKLVCTHGAKIKDFNTSGVTHIFATTMTAKKMEEWTQKPILKHQWIHDCIEAKKIVPWQKYRLFNTALVGGQRVIAFPVKNSPAKPVVLNVASPSPPPLHKIQSYDMNSTWVKANISTSKDFLERYFGKSRLHHLSTWRQDLKEYVQYHQMNAPKSNATNTHTKDLSKVIMHIDMDCFFASIAIRDQPHLADLPIAIAHSRGGSSESGTSSTADIASCNYLARSFGVKNGMILGKARILCPQLQSVPYEFEKYDAASRQLYIILLRYTNEVQAVSCDEAYINVASNLYTDDSIGIGDLSKRSTELANRIRAEIKSVTGCAASVGISHNLLLSRIATKIAKPDGVYFVGEKDVRTLLDSINVSELPGVGKNIQEKLTAAEIRTCKDVRECECRYIESLLGQKTGAMVHAYSRGIDERELENKERKSIGSDINWGVRFETSEEVNEFLRNLVREVVGRLQTIKMSGRHLTLKLKKKLCEGEPAYKVLGCGNCENISKSVQFYRASDDFDYLLDQVFKLYAELDVLPRDIRGVGIHIAKLEDINLGPAVNPIKQLFKKQKEKQIVGSENAVKPEIALKADCIDQEMLKSLPLDIQHEYGIVGLKAKTTTPVKACSSKDFGSNAGTKKFRVPSTPTKDRSKCEWDNLSFSQIDPQVFMNLPPSIQVEIQQQLEILKSSKKESNVRQSQITSLSQIDHLVYETLPADVKNEIKTMMRMNRNNAASTANTTPPRKGGHLRGSPAAKISKEHAGGFIQEQQHTIPVIELLQKRIIDIELEQETFGDWGKFPSKSQIDRTVYEQLPASIQKDIDAGLRNRWKLKRKFEDHGSKIKDTPSPIKRVAPGKAREFARQEERDILMTPSGHSDADIPASNLSTLPTFQGESDIKDIYGMLFSWIQQPQKQYKKAKRDFIDEAFEGDVLEVEAYLLQVIRKRSGLENVCSIMRLLRKGVQDMERYKDPKVFGRWIQYLDGVRFSAEQCVQEVYAAKLKI